MFLGYQASKLTYGVCGATTAFFFFFEAAATRRTGAFVLICVVAGLVWTAVTIRWLLRRSSESQPSGNGSILS